MQYRNKVTGNVIEVKSPVSGKNWEPVKAPNQSAPEEEKEVKSPTQSAPKEEKAVKKNGGSRK